MSDEYYIEMKIKVKEQDHFKTIDKYFGRASSAFNIIKNKYLPKGFFTKMDALLREEIKEFNKKK